MRAQALGAVTDAASWLAKDTGYDLIEWAGTQPWSNGKVGLAGVSYLAVSQWHAAAKRPPHLAAINPWEGWTDPYREVAYHGGIPDSWFYEFVQSVAQFGLTEHEDLVTMAAEHPLFDEYWKGKIALLENIEVPAYVVASWSDHGLHTRGTLEGFKRISSKEKWLEIHGRKKWGYYYDPESLERQEQFYTQFLKGQDRDVNQYPKTKVVNRHEVTVNRGRYTVHTGGDTPSHLVLPMFDNFD